MKKYLIILSIMLTLSFIGCTNANKPTTANVPAKEDNSSISNKSTDNSKKVTETSTDKSKEVTETSKENSAKSNKEESTKAVKTTASNSQITINEKSLDKNSTFYFGMSKEDLTSKLNKIKLAIENEIEITSSENDPEFGNKQIWTKDISFSFNKENKLYAINIKENIPTSLGLKNGDSIEKLEKLYGKDYAKYKTDIGLLYQYCINDCYFKVYFENGKLTEWGISKYKFLK
ncbi:hypothetical protein [Clostridium taeniosporum]|uniref:DUF4309 domain-containing protein n=1 Tax=Clostridium taeniosporum TaxID=394958 RepID=A0A1D7XPB4_9CLOT|nr:hypothetical protein [Clostridium taeniosporum]AOR25137.1 hypothetical protein BGI42_15460 [Clostridium taeniosporum]